MRFSLFQDLWFQEFSLCSIQRVKNRSVWFVWGVFVWFSVVFFFLLFFFSGSLLNWSNAVFIKIICILSHQIMKWYIEFLTRNWVHLEIFLGWKYLSDICPLSTHLLFYFLFFYLILKPAFSHTLIYIASFKQRCAEGRGGGMENH